MGSLFHLHGRFVHGLRVEALARQLAPLLPIRAAVLDVGCGDGRLASRVAAARKDLSITGLEISIRPRTYIPVRQFDGATIPLQDDSVDVILLVDVLHHTPDPLRLLLEARRVASKLVVIKDHLRQGLLAGLTLRFMDWVGNAGHGVALPYNYWTPDDWRIGLARAELRVIHWRTDLGLYPRPARWLFERSLHFVASLEKCVPTPPSSPRTECPARGAASLTS